MSNNFISLFHQNYRPDIDGLRAIAVLSVVGFHAFPDWIKGGFVGVDVFFVISGFLISTIIFKSLDSGTFSFKEFYSRRIRRIFPALIFVLVVCYVLGSFALLPDEFIQLNKHISAGAGFVSNLVLWNEAGYFDNSAETKPLLHLWSLGIEEQFYVIWPLLLYFAWKRKLNFFSLTVIVILVSFYLNITEIRKDGTAAFYSPLTRFWELLCGGLLALELLYGNSAPFSLRQKLDTWFGALVFRERTAGDGAVLYDVISFFGIVFLISGLWYINKGLAFPGKWALIPVFGAMLLIFAGPAAWCNRIILSNKIVVWFGLISFPLYLWHWPLLSFARIVESEVPSLNVRMLAVAFSILLAWLTYKLIERPIRFGGNGAAKVAMLTVSMLILGVVGYATYKLRAQGVGLDGLAKNSGPDLGGYVNNCKGVVNDPALIGGCLFQKQKGNTIGLLGDSHAGHLFYGLSEEVSDVDGVALFNFNCAAPFVDISTGVSSDRIARENNYKLINKSLDYFVGQASIDTVVLAHHPRCSFNDTIDHRNPSNKDYLNALELGVRRTLTILSAANKNIVIVLDNPALPFDPKLCIERPLRISEGKSRCSFSREGVDKDLSFVDYNGLINSVVRDFPRVEVVNLADYFCDKDRCYLSNDGRVLYADGTHLNASGSRFVAPLIIKAVERARGNSISRR